MKAKINAYAGFIFDGSLARAYAEAAGKPLRVQLDCVEQPPSAVATVIDQAATELAKQGIGFKVNVRN